jgi:hypothetical protein
LRRPKTYLEYDDTGAPIAAGFIGDEGLGEPWRTSLFVLVTKRIDSFPL